MSLRIENTTWHGWTGHIPGKGPVVKMEENKQGGMRIGPQSEDYLPGQATTWQLVATEADAIKLEAAATLLIENGREIVVLGPDFQVRTMVVSVTVSHKRVRHSRAKGVLVQAVWRFGREQQNQGGGGAGSTEEQLLPTRVYTGKSFGDWTLKEALRCESATEGYGVALGSAVLQQDWNAETPLAATKGEYVRIDVPQGEDPSQPTSWAPAWYGMIKSRDRFTDNDDIFARYTCLELASDLEEWLFKWYELTDAGDVGEVTQPLAINDRPSGNRSAAQHALGGAGNGYVHHRGLEPGLKWRSKEFADSLVEALQDQWPGGPVWSLTGQRSALDNQVPQQNEGRNAIEMLSQLMVPSIGWRVDVVGNNADLRLFTPLAAAITVGDFTLPANDSPEALDLTAIDKDELLGWADGEDYSAVKDAIAVEGASWHAGTFGIGARDELQLNWGWDASLESAWDAADEATRNSTELAMVYRRFELSRSWVGAFYMETGNVLPVVRATATNASFGQGGENGEWTSVGNNTWPWSAMRFTKALPFAPGEDWTSAATLPDIPMPEAPLIFVVSDLGGAQEFWERLDIEVTIDDKYPAVVLGRDAIDAATIKERLDGGSHIVITLGFNYPKPWRVSWLRAAADQAVSRARSIVYQHPDIVWRYMEAGTVVGLDASGQPVEAAAADIGDKPDALEEWLAFYRLRHETPRASLQYARTGVLDVSQATAPGPLLTTVTLPDVGAVTMNAQRTGRSWNFSRANYHTAYHAETLPVGIGPSMPQGPAGRRLLFGRLASDGLRVQ